MWQHEAFALKFGDTSNSNGDDEDDVMGEGGESTDEIGCLHSPCNPDNIRIRFGNLSPVAPKSTARKEGGVSVQQYVESVNQVTLTHRVMF